MFFKNLFTKIKEIFKYLRKILCIKNSEVHEYRWKYMNMDGINGYGWN